MLRIEVFRPFSSCFFNLDGSGARAFSLAMVPFSLIVVHDDKTAINITFGSVPQSVIGKPQASTPLCEGKCVGSESFIKRDFSLKVAF